jgi:SAM-dependent methyltransferase
MPVKIKPDLSAAFWRNYFRIYDRLAATRTNRRLIGRAVDYLRVGPGEAYLDLGCGTGNSTAEIVRRGGEVLGLDLSTFGLTRAQTKVPKAGFVKADMDQYLPLAPGSLSGALAINSLYLSHRPEQVLGEVLVTLKPGGRLVISNPRRGAFPQKILEEELQLEKEYLQMRYDWLNAKIRLAVKTAIRLADFAVFLPFQLVLKQESPHFEHAEFWGTRAKAAGFSIESVDNTLYGGQNDTLVLVKPLR